MRSGLVPRFVGRERELAALADAVNWPPGVVLVEGAAGVGKSRLVAESVSVLRGVHVATRRCLPPRDPFPLGVFIELLADCRRLGSVRSAAGALRSRLPELAHLLPAHSRPAALFDAVRDLVAAIGRAVLVIEDVQWADADTLRLLPVIAADPPPGLTLVVVYRPDDLTGDAVRAVRELGAHAAATVSVGPLDVAGVWALAGPVSEAAAEVLWERTGGFPFLVEQALGVLPPLDRADRRTAAALLDDAPVPGLVRDAVADAVRALSPAARALVEAAAVLGEPASADLLRAAADRPTARPEDTRGLLVEVAPGRYDHRTWFARRAVYEALSGPDRAHLHGRALRVLADSAPALRLATHARRAGDLAAWLRHGERAAGLAMAAGQQDVAIDQLRALVAAPGLPAAELPRLITALGRCALSDTRHDAVIAVLDRLRTDPRLTEQTRAEIDVTVALLMARTPGDLANSAEAITAAMKRPPAADDDRRLRGIALLAMPYFGTQTIDECRRWQDVICQRIGRLPPGATRTTLLASILQSRHEIGAPGVDEMIRLLPSEVDPADHNHVQQLARAHCNLGDTYAWTGHYERAREFLRSGVAHAVRAAAPYVRDIGDATAVRLDWLAGDWAGLDRRADALGEANPHSLPIVSEMRLVQGWLALAHADWSRAERCFLATRMSDPDSAVAPVAIAATGGMISLRLDRGDIASASALADSGVALLRHKGVWSWAGDLVPQAVQAYLAAGRPDDARALADELDAALTTLDAPYPAAALAAARAYLGPDRSTFDSAAERHRALDLPYHAARLAEHAACQPPVDTDALHRLAQDYERMGAAMAAARCRHLARTAGAAIPSRRGRRGYGNRLSPREAEIAHLLARGHTNREIAETLFISRSTVEQHVANTLRKLGTSRQDLLNSAS
ncbi:AAA family ATPase [Actinokineospora sp. UTMC 2448]|uniref:AAA family ATPase n=1 Tax=Actinokineospora sp. UTMC 2448 TaxID=2268449 RepID=UPI002164230B|nr:LuxR family transcriptional regulator [Actinokineospora sp. UTMC 2448]